MMTRERELLQQALDALLTGYHQGTQDAIAALREALAAPDPEPVALESVHLTRDTRGMCVVRVNGRVAIRDNGDIIDHMATLEWFAAPPAAPAPAGWVMVPRGLLRRLIAEALTFDPSLQDKEAIEQAKQLAASPAAPAAPPAAPAPAQPVPLTDEQLAKIAVEDEFLLYCDQDSFNEIARAIEAAHGITGGKP